MKDGTEGKEPKEIQPIEGQEKVGKGNRDEMNRIGGLGLDSRENSQYFKSRVLKKFSIGLT